MEQVQSYNIRQSNETKLKDKGRINRATQTFDEKIALKENLNPIIFCFGLPVVLFSSCFTLIFNIPLFWHISIVIMFFSVFMLLLKKTYVSDEESLNKCSQYEYLNDIIVLKDKTLLRRWSLVDNVTSEKLVPLTSYVNIAYKTPDVEIERIVHFHHKKEPRDRAIHDACLQPEKTIKELNGLVRGILATQEEHHERLSRLEYENTYNEYKHHTLPLIDTPYYHSLIDKMEMLAHERETLESYHDEKIKAQKDLIEKAIL